MAADSPTMTTTLEPASRTKSSSGRRRSRLAKPDPSKRKEKKASKTKLPGKTPSQRTITQLDFGKMFGTRQAVANSTDGEDEDEDDELEPLATVIEDVDEETEEEAKEDQGASKEGSRPEGLSISSSQGTPPRKRGRTNEGTSRNTRKRQRLEPSQGQTTLTQVPGFLLRNFLNGEIPASDEEEDGEPLVDEQGRVVEHIEEESEDEAVATTDFVLDQGSPYLAREESLLLEDDVASSPEAINFEDHASSQIKEEQADEGSDEEYNNDNYYLPEDTPGDQKTTVQEMSRSPTHPTADLTVKSTQPTTSKQMTQGVAFKEETQDSILGTILRQPDTRLRSSQQPVSWTQVPSSQTPESTPLSTTKPKDEPRSDRRALEKSSINVHFVPETPTTQRTGAPARNKQDARTTNQPKSLSRPKTRRIVIPDSDEEDELEQDENRAEETHGEAGTDVPGDELPQQVSLNDSLPQYLARDSSPILPTLPNQHSVHQRRPSQVSTVGDPSQTSPQTITPNTTSPANDLSLGLQIPLQFSSSPVEGDRRRITLSQLLPESLMNDSIPPVPTWSPQRRR